MNQHRLVHNLKFELHEANETVTVKLPWGSQLLSVENVMGKVTIYYLRYESNFGTVVEKKILFARTGHMFALPVNHRFIGTVVFNAGEYVLHAFDVTED